MAKSLQLAMGDAAAYILLYFHSEAGRAGISAILPPAFLIYIDSTHSRVPYECTEHVTPVP